MGHSVSFGLVQFSNQYGCLIKGDIELLEKVQKRATKLILTIKTMAYSERLKACKLPTFTL